jgi:hypothetical protein
LSAAAVNNDVELSARRNHFAFLYNCFGHK